MGQRQEEFMGRVYEFPDDATDEEIAAVFESVDPNVYDAVVTDQSRRHSREKERKDRMGDFNRMFPMDPSGLIGAGPTIIGRAASPVVRGLRSFAGRIWDGAAKNGKAGIADDVLSRNAGRLNPRNTQRLFDEAKAASTPAREAIQASSVLGPNGLPARAATEATEAVNSPLYKAAFAHKNAATAGRPSTTGRIIDLALNAAGIAAAPATSGMSLALNAARAVSKPSVRAAGAQTIYNAAGSPRAIEAGRAAAIAALLAGEGQ